MDWTTNRANLSFKKWIPSHVYQYGIQRKRFVNCLSFVKFFARINHLPFNSSRSQKMYSLHLMTVFKQSIFSRASCSRSFPISKMPSLIVSSVRRSNDSSICKKLNTNRFTKFLAKQRYNENYNSVDEKVQLCNTKRWASDIIISILRIFVFISSF